MANRIKMAVEHAILTLAQQGWSLRRIARELGVNRETVSRYVRLAAEQSKPAKATPGTEDPPDSKPAKVTPGSCGQRSRCEPFRPVVREKLELGLSAQRIWQDLVAEHGFAGSYSSVKRFVRRLTAATPLPFRRIETPPGQEAQVDFGRGAPVEHNGKRRRPKVFRIVLSYCRKAYSEAVWHESTESFIRALENAFWHFGGIPRTIVIDNLRAAVSQADWYEPELNPRLEAFCRHYGTVILPTKPRHPRHKGKIESGIKYVKGNALKGHVFRSLTEQNLHLARWESQVADHRIHGTTRKQVAKLFQQERPALLRLPVDRFPFFHEARRVVHRDAHVEVEKAYYSVPPEYLGQRVWARWDARLVRVFNEHFQQIALHVRKEPGRFSTQAAHIAPEKIAAIERGAGYLLKRVRRIGPQADRWARTMLTERGVRGLRATQGLVALARKHSSTAIEQACQVALSHGALRLRTLRRLLDLRSDEQQLAFIETHPLIRQLASYGRLARFPLADHEDDAPKPVRLPPSEEAPKQPQPEPPLRLPFLP